MVQNLITCAIVVFPFVSFGLFIKYLKKDNEMLKEYSGCVLKDSGVTLDDREIFVCPVKFN